MHSLMEDFMTLSGIAAATARSLAEEKRPTAPEIKIAKAAS